MRILILGASGLIGSAMLRAFVIKEEYQVYATYRDSRLPSAFPCIDSSRLFKTLSVDSGDILEILISRIKPDVVVNCIGVTKQMADLAGTVGMISANSILPHKVESLCHRINARFIHISTDCVFSGRKGDYSECDEPDPMDMYGRSKLVGEPMGKNTLVIRTSVIGHELWTSNGLLEWFLAQEGTCGGYVNAIFSGMTTPVLASLVRDNILGDNSLSGLYHISSSQISKYDLLRLVSKRYCKEIDVLPIDFPVIDRSLDSAKFRSATLTNTHSWPEMIECMYTDRQSWANA